MPSFKRTAHLAPAVLLGCFVVAALFPGAFAPVSPEILDAPYMTPDARHLLGTGDIGQDLLTELIYSARISLLVAFVAAILGTLLGTFVGIVSGYFQGAFDEWLMRITDVVLLLPSLPLIILLTAYMDSGPLGIALVIGLTAWPATARVVRANVLQERGKNYIRSARTFGAGHFYVMRVHVLPSILHVVLAKGTLAAASAMVTEAGVSFLGLGDPRFKSWGAMLHEAFTDGGLLNDAYGWYLPPIFCISVTVLCLILAGQHMIETEDEKTGIAGARGRAPLKPLQHKTGDRLQVKNLSVTFPAPGGTAFRALHGVNLTVKEGERMAVIGETGSGKSVLLLALMGLLPKNAAVTGEIRFRGQDLCTLSEKGFQRLRGRHLVYVPQGAGLALNPLMRVGTQVAEAARVHQGRSRKTAKKDVVAILDRLGIRPAAMRSREYPHQFSGGMIQRVLVAMGLVTGAPVILLDEPTKGLDPENRNDMLRILKGFEGKTFVLVTHDLLFARGFAHRVSVMLGSCLVETAPAADFFVKPLHPYAEALYKAQPACGLALSLVDPARSIDPAGCPFQSRCGKVNSKCRRMPPMKELGERSVRCWQYGA